MIARVLQAVSLISIIGMAANFISEMISHNDTPSDVLVGTLSVVRALFRRSHSYSILTYLIRLVSP